MKRFGVFFMMAVMVMVPALAGAYNQADVDRMVAGDKNMQNADLSDLNHPTLVQQQYKTRISPGRISAAAACGALSLTPPK